MVHVPVVARRYAVRVAALVAWGAAAACDSAERAADAHRDSTSAPASPSTSAASGGGAADGCPLTGAWRACSVEDRLERAGLAPQRQPDPVERAGFGVPGTRYAVGRGMLEIFVYESEGARDRAVAALDSATASPRGERTDWPATPTLMGSGNLAAVVYGVRDREVERVSLALSAGLPER